MTNTDRSQGAHVPSFELTQHPNTDTTTDRIDPAAESRGVAGVPQVFVERKLRPRNLGWRIVTAIGGPKTPASEEG